MNEGNENVLTSISNTMAQAVERGGSAIVLVDARRRLPASGVIYAPGLILTADHVVERDEDLRVVLPDGSQHVVTLAGRDPGSDLALLKLEDESPSPAKVAENPARIGQLALALGRPSVEGIQASLGVVSAIGGPVRTWRGGLLERYLRTDTIPYPGFSGGPLVDANGQVIGINTSGLARGVSLTIPVDLAWQVADVLAEHGQIRRGYLGIRSQPVNIPISQQQVLDRQQNTGLLLVGVETGGPADQAGLLVGDILVGLADRPIFDPDELLSRLVGTLVGQPVDVEILRGGQRKVIPVTIGERK